MLVELGLGLTESIIFYLNEQLAELQGDGIFRQYHRQFCHYFQDLSSKVDIHKDIWGPGHGVNNLTDNNQLALTARGPHQMSFYIISSLGVCTSGSEVIGDLTIICWGDYFQFLFFPNFVLLPAPC